MPHGVTARHHRGSSRTSLYNTSHGRELTSVKYLALVIEQEKRLTAELNRILQSNEELEARLDFLDLVPYVYLLQAQIWESIRSETERISQFRFYHEY
jgi:hypothetical protein